MNELDRAVRALHGDVAEPSDGPDLGAGRLQLDPGTGGQLAPAQAHGRDAEAVREYEEAFPTLLVESGLPTMMARLLT